MKRIRPQLIPLTRLDEARQLCWNGDYKRAAALYTEIIASGKDVAPIYAGLARAYLKMRKVDDAFKAASKAVELEPSLAAAHAALGDIYFRQGKLYEAEREYLTPLRAKNEDARAYFGLSRIYHTTFNDNRANRSRPGTRARSQRSGNLTVIGYKRVPQRNRFELLKHLSQPAATASTSVSQEPASGLRF
jgi:tetratricopeptide (TPR) repeat protein